MRSWSAGSGWEQCVDQMLGFVYAHWPMGDDDGSATCQRSRRWGSTGGKQGASRLLWGANYRHTAVLTVGSARDRASNRRLRMAYIAWRRVCIKSSVGGVHKHVACRAVRPCRNAVVDNAAVAVAVAVAVACGLWRRWLDRRRHRLIGDT